MQNSIQIHSLRWGLSLLLIKLFLNSAMAAPLHFEKSCIQSAAIKKENLGRFQSSYSKPENLRELEEQYSKSKELNEMGVEFPSGALDTKVLQEAYSASSQRVFWERASQTELLELDYALLLTEKKLSQYFKKGIHPSKIKGEGIYEGFIAMRSYLSQIPDEKLRFSIPVLAKAYHLLQSKTDLSFWKAFQTKLGLRSETVKPDELPEISPVQSLLLSKAIRKNEQGNIKNSLETLKQLGLFQENSLIGLRALDLQPTRLFSQPKSWFGNQKVYKISFKNQDLRNQSLKSLENWIQNEMFKIDQNKPDAMDPIELAGISEYAMHFIRAFPEKNYVLAKAVKNRILQKYGLAVDLRFDEGNLDYLNLSLQDFVNNVRKGVFYAIHMIENRVRYEDGPNVLDTSIGLHADAEMIDQLPQDIKDQLRKTMLQYKGAHSHAIEVGSNIRKKLIFKGQFFVSTDDLTYTYVKAENRFYPISEMDLVLYSQGGVYKKHKVPTQIFNSDSPTQIILTKAPNRVFTKSIADNIELFSKIVRGEINPKDIPVLSIEEMMNSNKNNNFLGSHKIYDFQKDLIEAALENPLDPQEYPLTFLAVSRSYNPSWIEIGPSYLQELVTLNRLDQIKIEHITSAYSFRRNFLLKLRRDLELFNPEHFEINKDRIDQERENIYIAARTLLMPYIEFMKEAFETKPGKSKHPSLQDKEFHRHVQKHAYWRSLYTYFKASEWAYPTYEMALTKVDQKTQLVSRNIATGNFNLQGLSTETQQSEGLFYKVFGQQIKILNREIESAFFEGRNLDPQKMDNLLHSLIISLLQKYDKNDVERSAARIRLNEKIKKAIRKIATGVLKERYSTRGLLPSNQRFFMDNYLHSEGTSPQVLKSTSVNPFFLGLVHQQDGLSYIPGGSNYIYRLKIGEESLNSEFSMYPSEAEVLENVKLGPISARFRLVFKASEEDLIQDPSHPFTKKTDELLTQLVHFEKDHPIIPPQSEIKALKKISDVLPQEASEILGKFEDFEDFGEFDGPGIIWDKPE